LLVFFRILHKCRGSPDTLGDLGDLGDLARYEPIYCRYYAISALFHLKPMGQGRQARSPNPFFELATLPAFPDTHCDLATLRPCSNFPRRQCKNLCFYGFFASYEQFFPKGRSQSKVANRFATLPDNAHFIASFLYQIDMTNRECKI